MHLSFSDVLASHAVGVVGWLAERERKSLNTRIKEFNLKNHVFDRPFLTDELIHSRLLNLAQAISGGIASMIVAGCCATIQRYFETNWRAVLRRTQDHMKVARMEPEHNLAGPRFKFPAV